MNIKVQPNYENDKYNPIQTVSQYKQFTTYLKQNNSKDLNSVLDKIHTFNFIHCRIDPKTLGQKTLDFIKDVTFFKEAFYDEVE